MTATSGQSSTPTPEAVTAAPSGPPTGYIQLSEAEHNRAQAELRKLRKSDEARQTAEAERQRLDHEARGQYDAALETERTQRQAAEARVRDMAVQGALRDAVMAEGLTGEKAAALLRLVPTTQVAVDSDGNPDAAAASAAVKATRAQFGSLFDVVATPAPTPPTDPAGTPAAPAARVAPPATPPPPSDGSGLLTMEEYAATPREVRMTPEFQDRVKRAEHTWKKKPVPAGSFAQGV